MSSHHLRHVESMATLPSGAGSIPRLNAVILGEALASEKDDLVFPSHDFCRQALVPNPQKVNLSPPLLPALVNFLIVFCVDRGNLNFLFPGRGDYQYLEMYKRSIEDPAGFWSEIASEFYWKQKWVEHQVYSENLDIRKGNINIEWFKGGTTNICYNCLDRNIESGNGDRIAIYWEGNEPGLDATLTYTQLLDRVCQLANYLKDIGVRKGDAVVIYLPMLMELPIAMLACARIGAVHSVVFAGFSAESLAQRIVDCKPKAVITCNAVRRGSKVIYLKGIVDAALVESSRNGISIDAYLSYGNVSAMKREATEWREERDIWWQVGICTLHRLEIGICTIILFGKRCNAVNPFILNMTLLVKGVDFGSSFQDVVPKYPTTCAVEWLDSEDPLFLLYTSGSTGKPKGLPHTTGGYMIYTATTFKYAFDYKPSNVYWCTADCGWITGHSYVTYEPLLNGAGVVVYEGASNYPDPGRCWDIVDKDKVTIFYTAPTLVRSLMRDGDEARKSWFFNVVGDSRCPISDTWWQTETGGFMVVILFYLGTLNVSCALMTILTVMRVAIVALQITPLPGAWPQKPGSATFPFYGVQPVIVNEKGVEIEGECSGYLCVKSSWPGAFRTLYGDHERYETTYFKAFPGYYFSGDGCSSCTYFMLLCKLVNICAWDKDGYHWLTGRVDDVINVSGHRIGTAEVESALVSHPHCAEAAVVGVEHEVKGQGIYAFVTLVEGVPYSEELRRSLVLAVRNQQIALLVLGGTFTNRELETIDFFAAPDKVHWAPGLPKTRSGKIMRRILRKIASRQLNELGDTSTLADPNVVDQLIELADC
ncbi:hypothetical protein RJ639_008426 [Escallonia herrerae]|uniref:acetate--CoA ligase n=1 Tax=Escallonia herrerae TaxID=1293975 RepID=A0AA88VTL9_9ASTE|nr:hypothetical protein RJ639_008426 [Escallonia herrerae]